MDTEKAATAGADRTPENGAIIIEATLTLSFFMFAMITLLSVIQIAYAQSRMSVALCSATKSIAEYAHIYFATGMDEVLPVRGKELRPVWGDWRFHGEGGRQAGPDQRGAE